MEIWKINITGKGICLYFFRWTQRNQLAPSLEDPPIHPRGATCIQDREETAKSPGGEVSSTSHGGFKNFQEMLYSTSSTLWSPYLGTDKTLTDQAENLVSQQGMPQNPENIFATTLALLAFASPAQADLINHTYWAYIPNPPLLQVVEWTDIGLVIPTNDSVHMPPPWSLEGPSHPEEEGRLILL